MRDVRRIGGERGLLGGAGKIVNGVFWKGYCIVEAGTVDVNSPYYQEEDNDNVELLGG